MVLKTCYLILFCFLILTSLRTMGQSGETSANKFIRYESGAAVNRLKEDVLTLTLSMSRADRPKIGIRVCSKDTMPFALVTASADPFLIADLLSGYGYSPGHIIYLRSEDCISSHNRLGPVTEVWIIPEAAVLPSHAEAATGDQVRKISLGKEEVNRGVRDYKLATRKLIQYLRAKPAAVGVVFGYFLNHPSLILQSRLREVRRTLERSGLPHERFLVRPMDWNDEVSTYPPDVEPTYPRLFVVEVTKPDSARR